MGRLVPAEEDAGSEVSGWELRELWEREEERRAEAEELGAVGELGDGEELPCSYPRPRSWLRQMRIRGRNTFSFVLSIVRAHLISFPL